jgi:hypothetical protein
VSAIGSVDRAALPQERPGWAPTHRGLRACCGCTSFSSDYSLSDEALEDMLYDSQAMREFVGTDLAREQLPDATTC